MSLQSPTLSFAPDKAKAAAERVQRAAAKFGPEQSKAAKAWAKNAVGAGSADATSLLREEVGSTNPYPSRLAFGGGSAARSMRPRCPFYATALPVPCDRAARSMRPRCPFHATVLRSPQLQATRARPRPHHLSHFAGRR